MRKIKLLSLVLAFALIIGANSIVFADNNNQGNTETGQVGTEASEQDNLDDLIGINRKPIKFNFQKVAENKSLLLEMDKKEGALRLTAKKSGAVWQSSVSEYPTDKLASGLVRNQMASQIIVKYVDKLGNITAISSKECVNAGSVSYEPVDAGMRVVYKFSSYGFEVPVEYTLNNDYMQVSVKVNKIAESNPNYRIHTISILPYFGTGSLKDTGYMLVPDGSGALIRFNNQKGRMAEYVQDIYGRDGAISVKAQGPVVQTAFLPVFGVQKNGQAFLAVIQEGDARARIRANVSGVTSEYNNVYPEFFYRNYDSVVVKEKNWDAKTIRVFEEVPASCEHFTVRYYPLVDHSPDYVGMALRYQQYLKDEQGVKPLADSTPPLYVEMYGSIKKLQYFMGIPYISTIKLTAYEDAARIAEELSDMGVKNAVMHYQIWGANSSDRNIPVNLKTSRVLGGKKGFEDLAKRLQGLGMSIFCDVNITEMTKSSWGYTRRWDGTKALNKSPVTLYTFHLGTYEPVDNEPMVFLLKPAKVLKAAQTAANRAKILPVTGLSANTLGNQLYSDYSKEKVDRTESQKIWQQSLRSLYDAKGALLLSSPSAYALSTVTHITDVPTDSSQYLIADESVPFYTIALHSLLNMSISALNYQSNPQAALLRALELGVGIKFTWTAHNESKLTETSLDHLYNGNYKVWIEQAASMQKTIDNALSGLNDKAIIGHEKLNGGVTKTTYSDGTVVYVNHQDRDVTVEGHTIGAKSYLMSRKSDSQDLG